MSSNDALLKNIEAGKAAAVYLITGEEFLVRKASDELVAKLLPKAMAGLNLAVHEGSSPAEVARDLATAPMFRGRKVVVVRDPEFLAPKKGRPDALNKIKEAWSAGRRKVAANRALALFARAGWGPDQLAKPDAGAVARELEIDLAPVDLAFLAEVGAFCKAENLSAPEGDTGALERLLERGVPRDSHLVVEAVHLDSRGTLAKLLAQAGVLVERKVGLEPGAEKLLKDLCGGNMRLLQSELHKLALYVGDKPSIGASDVELLVRRAREEEFRELSDALGTRDLRAALRYLNTALDQDEPALKLHGALASVTRRMLEDRVRWGKLGFGPRTGQREFEAKGLPALEEEMEQRGGKVPHPYVAWLGFQACMRYEVRELVQAMLAIAAADVSLKSGGDDRLVLESLALKLCQRPA